MSVVASNAECPLVKELSNCLKENSRSGIVSCLTRIKTDEKCSRRVLENGGVCLLVELLRYRNTRVMDTTLSILANACLLSHVREKVEGTKIASYVVWIAKNLESGETMHCRACRLMGNLAESSNHARALCDAGAVAALTEILRSKSNAQTLGMAVRAVRNIWTINVNAIEEILEAGTIRDITSLLVRSRKKITERENDTKYAELAESCLKAMHVFADCKDVRSSEQMRGEKEAHGYRCIVDYCRAGNKTAIKCLYKLCLFAGRRPDLGTSGAIECLVETLGDASRWTSELANPNTTASTSIFWESLVSLCMFCREAVNRVKIRRGSGLEAMLSLLKQARTERYHPMLLRALVQFVLDDLSVDIMVKNGIVDVLVEKLKKMAVKKRTCEMRDRDGKMAKKRSADTSPYGRGGDFKHNRTSYQYGRFSLDYPREDWSPGGTSASYSSPPSTPPLLHYETYSDNDENADDDYSPICSDNEWLEDEDSADAPRSKHMETDDELPFPVRIIDGSENEDEDYDFTKPEKDAYFDKGYSEDNEEEQGSNSTLALLATLAYSNEPIERLSDSTTIQALAAYIASAKNYRASVILEKIIRNRAYFVPLLLQGFVFEAQTLYGTENYTRALCDVADTGGAFGEMATLLLRGRETQKIMVAISVPYVIKSREKLRILLNTHGGLELIYRAVEEPKNSLHENAILAVCKLANSLGVSTPEMSNDNEAESVDKNERDNENRDRDEGDENSRSNVVIFELDDGSTVETPRTTVCEKSRVFAAMLEGNFSESGKKIVRLRKASNDGLSILLTAMRGVFEFEKITIEAILDAVLLADKFLMSDISERLTEMSMELIDHENLCRAWNWSRMNYCHEFRNCCVKMFLTLAMSRSHRLRAFRDFHQSPCFPEFLKDVRDIIDTSLELPRI